VLLLVQFEKRIMPETFDAKMVIVTQRRFNLNPTSGGKMKFIRGAGRVVKTLRAIITVGVVISVAAVVVGCRTPKTAANFGESIWGDFGEAKSYVATYKHVVLVCVYEDHWEDRGPHKYSLHHFKTTVVRTYKGNWNTSETLTFVHGVDARADSVVNADAGKLLFVFTNDHTSREFGLDTGEFLNYDPEIERQLRLVISTPNRPHSPCLGRFSGS
jgi:hypothetical protein